MRPLAWALALGLGVAGCARAGCPTETLSAGVLEAAQATSRAAIQSLKVDARIEQWGKKGRLVGSVLMFLQAPSQVRVDVMSQLGPLASMSADAERFQFYDKREGRYLHGPVCAQTIATLLGVRLTAEQLFDLLSGRAPLHGTEGHVSCKRGRHAVERTLEDGSVERVVFAHDDKGTRVLEAKLTGPGGQRQYKVTMSGHRRDAATGVLLPTTIRFIDGQSDTEIRVKAIDVNVNVPDEAFSVPVPAGVVAELVSC